MYSLPPKIKPPFVLKFKQTITCGRLLLCYFRIVGKYSNMENKENSISLVNDTLNSTCKNGNNATFNH
jgi:hypothetical protein